MYIYRILTLLDNHLLYRKHLISFQKRDASTVSADDQPEDILIWVGNKRPTTLSPWLARQLSITEAVDLAYGVESIRKKLAIAYRNRITRDDLSKANCTKSG